MSSMALQQTFSGFPSGCPGFALLLLRFASGGASFLQPALLIAGAHHAAATSILPAALVILASLALIIGLMTPIATVLLCLGGMVVTIDSDIAAQLSLFESWVSRLEFVVMSAALICLGPGAFSLDARLYGRREIEVNENGS
jgi:uncharacterized membrane protein YphA (DoxX/SURF4 family)